ncbi:hypothetical protein, partial [Acinetobacter baumannii]|uniref:hypothetical protein n=1 Tax=Acinetobacter baumannii TaxID=470 RepID=UPI001BC86D60
VDLVWSRESELGAAARFLIGQVLYESLIFNIFNKKSYVFFIAQTLSILSIYQLLCFKEKRLGSASKLK